MYYPRESLKSKLCLRGRTLLLEYLKQRHVPHSVFGKLIVATSANEDIKLRSILQNATESGIHDLQYLSQGGLCAVEPLVSGYSALLSPFTAIFDSHAFMQHLAGDITDSGSSLVVDCEFLSAQAAEDGFQVCTSQGDLRAKYLVNAAGLHSSFVAENISPYPRELVPRCYYAKGNYFKLRGKSPFTRLVYPLPGEGGLGIHCTIDLNGLARFGPDVEWLTSSEGPDSDQFQFSAPLPKSALSVDASRSTIFYEEIRRYWPDLPENSLEPDYAGIRPKLIPPHGNASQCGMAKRDLGDFLIEGPSVHGIPGLVNLFGIESPGLSSSLAIGDFVKEIITRS